MESFESYSKKIIIDESKYNEMTDEQKQLLDHMIETKFRRDSSVYMIYRPSCGCQYETPVLVDRAPMSKKIHHLCQGCKKGTLLEIKYPITFYIPITDTFYNLEDIMKMQIMDGPQKPYLEAYKFYFTIAYLEMKCEDDNEVTK